MPRVSVRKLFIYLLGMASFGLLIFNIQHGTLPGSETWNSLTGGGPTGPGPTGARKDSSRKDNKPAGPSKHEVDSYPTEESDPASLEPLQALYMNISERPKKAFDLSPLDPNNLVIPERKDLPWYMKDGQLKPKHCQPDPESTECGSELFPWEAEGSDRMNDQLMYFPPKGKLPEDIDGPDVPLKKILLWNGANSWGNARQGRGVFLKEKCPVSSCVVTTSRSDAQNADLVIFKDHFTMPTYKRPKRQLWLMYMLECPLHTQMFKSKDVFNWTATYRSDSTIVAPYERWVYYNENVKFRRQERNFAQNKTKAVAWFVSNCGARNGRLQFAKELQKHIQVDIYGSCGSKKCPRSKSGACFKMLDTDYKFYLAFENSNCQDYITEKFFVNGLGHDVVPIVMGARPEDYYRSAPRHSYIHVDDFKNAKELAKYLHKLDQNDDLYNEYFRYKGTGEFVNTKFFCRVCALLHDDRPKSQENSYYQNINDWWRKPGTCINGSWRKYKEAVESQKKKDQELEKGPNSEEAEAAEDDNVKLP